MLPAITTPTGGALQCWGQNGHGQLGDGTTTYKSLPTPVTSLASGVTAVSGGVYHTCAVASGGAKCWGQNAYGQLGDGTTSTGYNTPSSVPTDVSTLATGVVTFDAGDHFTCALTSGGAAYCWGQNLAGEIGDGSNGINKPLPTLVSGMTSGVKGIAAGGAHTCAVDSAGAVKCWGSNYYGQLGDGTTTTHHLPAFIHPG